MTVAVRQQLQHLCNIELSPVSIEETEGWGDQYFVRPVNMIQQMQQLLRTLELVHYSFLWLKDSN